MSGVRAYPRAHRRPAGERALPYAELERTSSHAAVPVAVGVVLVGLYLARFSLLLPGFLGALLLASALSFLAARVNPLSPHFYLSRKPSWTAIGVVLLGGLGLLGYAYALWAHGQGTVVPHV